MGGIDRSGRIEGAHEVFIAEILEGWNRRATPDSELEHRLEILTAGGEAPRGSAKERRIAGLRTVRAAWEAYVSEAARIGLLGGAAGSKLRSDLRSSDENTFRGGLAECLASWFFNRDLGIATKPGPVNRKGGFYDLEIELRDGPCLVEVKSPNKPPPEGPAWVDDSEYLEKSGKNATKQLLAGERNLVVFAAIATQQVHVLFDRMLLEKAFHQEWGFAFSIPSDPGDQPIDLGAVVTPRGLLGTTKQGEPMNTRVSAVMPLVESVVWGDRGFRVYRSSMLMHNRHAAAPLPTDNWPEPPTVVQFLERDGQMVWTDGWSP